MNLNSSLQKTPIAVIGLSAIFADAKNIEEYWTNIIQGRDSITDVPDSRWSIEDYYDPDMSAPDKTYCKRGGFIPEIDFNPMEFGLPPNILEVTDASQLLGLVAARDALEDAGYGKESAKFSAALKAKTGVLLGVGGGQKLITPLIARLQYPIWEKALRSSGVDEKDIPHIVDKMKKAYIGWNENSFPGLLGNVISGRITNRFDLGGINSVVDAACAASLSAIKMSLSELVEGRCDMMLTGGVDTDNSPFMYMSFSKTPAFSRSGNISPFSETADGMLIGEGIGMLVLKRLEDAERDGDRIYATIKGVGTSSDGRFKSVYAPRSSGQALAMERAYEDAGFPAHTVGLVEGHGTGTMAGDPTEFESMRMVFSNNNPKKQHIALGSVKSQIGHTKAAAGAAGMVKAVLGLHHKVLPPTINVEKPNEKFNIKDTPMYVNTEARPWIRNGSPRRAGVSAFGFGGINVHLALEEYEGAKEKDYRLHQPNKCILLYANTPAELRNRCIELATSLQSAEAKNTFDKLIEESNNAQISAQQARLGFVTKNIKDCVSTLNECAQLLNSDQPYWDHPKGIHYRNRALDMQQHKVVALFAGQGSQYIGMGTESANAFPTITSSFEKIDKLFTSRGETALSKIVYPIPVFNKEEKVAQLRSLTRTENAQPAIGTLSMGQYKVLSETGFKADFTAGHSFGELTALWAAGVYDENTFLALAKNRGTAMAIQNPNADSGTMMAVKESVENVQKAIQGIPGVKVANINSTNQVVLGGSTEGIAEAEKHLSGLGYSVIKLPVSAAFHTDFVRHAQKPFSDFVDIQNFKKPEVAVFANSTGDIYPSDPTSIKNLLKNQILNPVYFKNQIDNIYAAGGRIFVEFGPKGVLTNLVKNILKDKGHRAIAVNPNAKKDSDLQLRQAYVQLAVLGLPLSNLDPFRRHSASALQPSKMNVRLSGNNYVSDKTKQAYVDVMNNEFQISKATSTISPMTAPVVENKSVKEQILNEEEMLNLEALKILRETVDSFKSNQTKSLEIFERFMESQNQQSNQLLQVLSQVVGSDNNSSELRTANAPKLELENSYALQKTMPISNGNGHSNGSNNGNGFASNVSTSTPTITTNEVKVSPSPLTQTVVSNNDTSALEKILLEVVSEKTGYPAEMLELSMDMEADLGIDSIKRVEIFGALTAQHPSMGDIDPNELTELRTLGEIVNFVSAKGGSAVAQKAVAIENNTSVSPQRTVEQTSTPAMNTSPATSQADNSALTKILLEVVSEKTGYPAEMLELNMDMEADLGIDSIKRVEIFGALTAQYPEMSGIDPNELTELRTLGEIVSFVSGKGGNTVAANASTQAPDPTVQTAPASNNGNGSIDTSALQAALLEVVSEKTGYPAEMLELSMDMEADLGIDSIKRVEIFGALTTQYPDMTGIDPNELTELRTLGEIVSFVGARIKKKSLSH